MSSTFKTHYVTSSKILIQCSFRSIVMNPVRDLTLAHHIDACTTLLLHVTHGLHFPSTIALITQLSPITHCTDYTAESHQTLFISLGLPLSHRRVLFVTPYISERFPCVFSCWLPGPFTLIWPFAACLFDPACLLDILSVCRLPRPLHCPCLSLSLAYVTLVAVDWTLPVWPPLV